MPRPTPRCLAALFLLHGFGCGPTPPPQATPPHAGPTATHTTTTSSSSQAPGATGTTSAKPPAAANTPTLASKYQAILDRHNRHRADHCAPPLQWSEELAAVAQAWADRLKKAGCAFEHSQGSPFGENLSFFAPVGSSSPDDVATGWYSEVSAYNFAKGSFDFNTGHFTQVVWRGTRALGCGQSQCNGGELWVCNYDPPGNMMGAFQQNVLPTTCKSQ